MSARRPPKSSEAIERAAVLLGDTVKRDRPIGELTTYRVGGAAALYLEPSGVAEIARLGEVIGATGSEVLVLGKGSYLLVADAGFSGLCVRLGDGFASIEIDGRAQTLDRREFRVFDELRHVRHDADFGTPTVTAADAL